MSATTNQMTLDPSELNPTDVAILDELHGGRCTPAYIAEKHGYTSGNVRNRMTLLATHDHVNGLGGGLYELLNDPRDADTTSEPDTPADAGAPEDHIHPTDLRPIIVALEGAQDRNGIEDCVRRLKELVGDE